MKIIGNLTGVVSQHYNGGLKSVSLELEDSMTFDVKKGSRAFKAVPTIPSDTLGMLHTLVLDGNLEVVEFGLGEEA